MQIREETFVIVDLETTGMRPDQHRIIEIGAVKVCADRVQDTFEALVDPECRIPRRITQITGITPADIFGMPYIHEILPDLMEFMGNAVIVAHNCTFDWSFLASELGRAALPVPSNPRLCTVRMARRLLPGLPSRSLGSLIDFFEVKTDARHRALSDALATQQIFSRLLHRLEVQYQITQVEALLHFQNTHYGKRSKKQGRQSQILEHRLKDVPSSPGVYCMLNKEGKRIYVGKSRNLSERVRSYFTGMEGHPPHIRKMVSHIHDIDWIRQETEVEALLLESQLIKEHTPPYNKAGRSYRHRPFLRIGKIANTEWVTVIEHIRADGARYYGPMESRREAVELARALIALYGEAPTSFQLPERNGLGLEASRIGGPLTEEGVRRVCNFLEGMDSSSLEILLEGIRQASEVLAYEVAAQRRDWLAALEAVNACPHFLKTELFNRSGAVLYALNNKIEVHFMAFGIPAVHVVWPCDKEVLRVAETKFFSFAEKPPERFTMQQLDRISLFGSWMFREREKISVLPLLPGEASSAFDKRLMKLLQSKRPDFRYSG